jgi:hypothetical protein
MKNSTNFNFQSKHLPIFGLAWQAWKLLDTSSTIFFKGCLVAGAFFLFGTALSGGPFFNEETRVRMRAQKVCIANGLTNLDNDRYYVYRFCEAYAVKYADAYMSQNETREIY